MGARAVLTVVLVAVLAAVGAALVTINRGEREGAEIYDRTITVDGDPSLMGLSSSDAEPSSLRWRICDPECGGIVGREQDLDPGRTEPGTVFQFEATNRGKTTVDRSPEWRGQVRSVAPPTSSGELLVGHTIEPRAGRWRGGWGDDMSELGLQACRTPRGGDCRPLTGWLERTLGAAVLNTDDVGWYVGPFETRVGSLGAGVMEGWVFRPGQARPYPAPAFPTNAAGGTLRGPVRPAPVRELPTIDLKRSVKLDGRERFDIGRVHCPQPCTADVQVRQGGRWFGGRVRKVDGDETIDVLPDKDDDGSGRLDVRVRFGAYDLDRTGRVKVE